ncbi:unnamed protein product [Eruca vesicaria subsp. sativa]|uniref:Legume lectin domain-containing protein n=1 Tax=Eruca vesicaria subsp. sativa TaxID=29727 RepID=A0ABC8JNQ6_ERUVS|nr:unnamed protein product [Eruca vesicaria subsp. sativa]
MLVMFCFTHTSHGLIMKESAGIMNGFTTLTNTKKNSYGQAFNDKPFPFKSSANGTLTSFSFTFFFAIVPEHYNQGSHGMAFVISPTKGIPGASADQYLGIFNDRNNGDSSNHIIAVELDIHKDDEFGDIDDNHVGININGMRSIVSAPAGYYDQNGSTGSLGAIHYMLVWYAYTFIIVPQLDFEIPTFPPYPKVESKVKLIVLATSLTLALFVAFAASAVSLFLYKKHKKVLEVLEEWEIECGPHRFGYSELYKATNGFKELLGEGGFGKVFKDTLPESEQAVLLEWVVTCWKKEDIIEAVCERIKQDHDKGQLELLLKLGVLCSHQAEEVRPNMSTVVKILEGVSELPDNVLDIVRTEKKGKWYEKYSEVLDSVTNVEPTIYLDATEPIASLERTRLLL